MADTVDFEHRLRRDLARAAVEADTSRAGDLVAAARLQADGLTAHGERPARKRARRPWQLQVAATVTAVAAGGLGWWALTVPDDSSTADCALQVKFDGTRWMPFGDLRRVPVPADRVGVGVVPICDDGNGAAQSRTVALFAIEGVDQAAGLLGDGDVWVPYDTRRQAPALAELDETAPCTSGVEGNPLAGRIIGVSRPDGGAAGTVPYTAEFEVRDADNGGLDGFAFPGYAAVTVPLRVTEETLGGGPRMLSTALDQGSLVDATVACAGDRYHATIIAAR